MRGLRTLKGRVRTHLSGSAPVRAASTERTIDQVNFAEGEQVEEGAELISVAAGE